jgi:hypothetical protein
MRMCSGSQKMQTVQSSGRARMQSLQSMKWSIQACVMGKEQTIWGAYCFALGLVLFLGALWLEAVLAIRVGLALSALLGEALIKLLEEKLRSALDGCTVTPH